MWYNMSEDMFSRGQDIALVLCHAGKEIVKYPEIRKTKCINF